jgi:serine/threonine-protein kinase
MVPRIGRYEILGRIGVGGMAEVFRARARGPGGYERELVIKQILPGFADDPEFVRMFVAEAKILGMLHHPNIVEIYDFGEDQGRHFLALQYVEGPSVADILARLRRKRGRMPPAMAALIAQQVCQGLSAVHDLRGPEGRPLNVIHRDVTPSNIVVTLPGLVKLLDFGVAKVGALGGVTRLNDLKGKSAYLTPEQLQERPLDGRADLFTIGIVLHEMLTLQPLFAGRNDLDTVCQVMELKIEPPGGHRRHVPAALDRIVMRALERDRGRRYQTAHDMAADLEEVVASAQLRRDDVVAFAKVMWNGANGAADARPSPAPPSPAPGAVTPRANRR